MLVILCDLFLAVSGCVFIGHRHTVLVFFNVWRPFPAIRDSFSCKWTGQSLWTLTRLEYVRICYSTQCLCWLLHRAQGSIRDRCVARSSQFPESWWALQLVPKDATSNRRSKFKVSTRSISTRLQERLLSKEMYVLFIYTLLIFYLSFAFA